MDITIAPGPLAGNLEAIPSKSQTHRILIAETLADIADIRSGEDAGGSARFEPDESSLDIRATKDCCEKIKEAAADGSALILDCGESGSTLRFLLPVVSALGLTATFTGHGRLPERPVDILTGQMSAHGVNISEPDTDGDGSARGIVTVSGHMTGGEFELPGNVSSQYITGLLLALPLCGGGTIRLTTELESSGYVDMTLDVMEKAGVRVGVSGGVYTVPDTGYGHTGIVKAEGDWSNAAFWLAADYLGSDVGVSGLDMRSKQGDRRIVKILSRFRDLKKVDASDIPDLVPVLAVLMAATPGVRKITNASRLRIKESDRLAAMTENLTALGIDARETPDGIRIRGGKIQGGEVSGFNDHRIVMACAVAATVASGPVTIHGAEAAAKSYPRFFTDFRRLKGNITGGQND
ncbi:MAG: 3-phosphoshikimate 1-carboxyvinyltransferase [Anaerovoracaceae bacterium]|jgi:3-phosphoshikimate 1-carboxyvinyltransferase